MKWLILFGLLFILWTFIAVRYRPQIQTALYVWKMFRKMRRADIQSERRIKKTENLSDVRLVKCGKCGIWIPQKSALNLRSGMFYCSANCMESAVKVG